MTEVRRDNQGKQSGTSSTRQARSFRFVLFSFVTVVEFRLLRPRRGGQMPKRVGGEGLIIHSLLSSPQGRISPFHRNENELAPLNPVAGVL
jgi:hypothetical protein